MKDAGLRIRVRRDLREKFLEVCRAQDKPAAQVLREFMRGYVAQHDTSARNEDTVSSLAGRLARLDKQLDEHEQQRIKEKSGVVALKQIVANLLEAIDPVGDQSLRDDGVSYGDYLEQLTYLIFLKMANECAKAPTIMSMRILASLQVIIEPGPLHAIVQSVRCAGTICAMMRWKSWSGPRHWRPEQLRFFVDRVMAI